MAVVQYCPYKRVEVSIKDSIVPVIKGLHATGVLFQGRKEQNTVDATKEKKKQPSEKSIKRLLKVIYTKIVSGCIALLRFFAYYVPSGPLSINAISLIVALVFPFVILVISAFVLDQTDLGLFLVLVTVVFKFILSEFEYKSYRQQFMNNGKWSRPPANPHQTARGMYLFAIPFTVIVFFLHCIYVKEITFIGAKIVVGGIVLLLSLWQDLSASLVCIFAAEYPKIEIQHGSYAED